MGAIRQESKEEREENGKERVKRNKDGWGREKKEEEKWGEKGEGGKGEKWQNIDAIEEEGEGRRRQGRKEAKDMLREEEEN